MTTPNRAPVVLEVSVLVLWTGMLAFYGLDAGFLYRTEALRALVARNMLHSGDYVLPTLYGEPLLTKGPVMYAAIAWASWPFGEVTTWSARIPAALAMILTSLLMFSHLQRYVAATSVAQELCESGRGGIYLSRRGALLVTLMMVCNPLWLDKGTSAEIDMLVVFWVALSLVAFYRAVDGGGLDSSADGKSWDSIQSAPASSRQDRSPSETDRIGNTLREVFWWSLALLAVALGSLTKWHAPVFFYASAITYLFYTGRMRVLFSIGHLTGVALAVALVAGWVGLIVQRVGWAVLWNTLWEQALPRVSPLHQQDERLWLEMPKYPLKMLLCGLPWSAFVGLTMWRTWREALAPTTRALVRTLHCWIWPNLLVFTLLPDHDARHGMPLLAGWSTLGALSCVLGLSSGMPLLIRRTTQSGLLLVLSGFALLLLGSVPLASGRLPSALVPRAIGIGVVAGFLVLAGWWASRREHWLGVVASLLLLWGMVKIAFVEVVVPIRSVRDPVGKAAKLRQAIPNGEALYIFQAKDEGIMFYYGGKVLRVRGWEQLPQQEHVYCLATQRDMTELVRTPHWRIVWQRPFLDEQGDPMVLVLLQRSPNQARPLLPLPAADS
ncbi:MAG: hypothetical protein RMJ82_09685 [Gemmatales bacterium]|nr:hypothetical protein [Gemmatales bacterium]